MNRKTTPHKPATRPKLSMRFFGAKSREHRKRDQQQQQQLTGEAVEARTDVANKKGQTSKDAGTRELVGGGTQQQQQHHLQSIPKRKGMQGLLRSPISREKEPSGVAFISPRGTSSRRGSASSDILTDSPKTNIQAMKVAKEIGPLAQHLTIGGSSGGPPNKPLSPPSILHRKKPGTSMSPVKGTASPTSPTPYSPPYTYSISQLPAAHNPRVRFLSSGSSVASTEASQIHLMAAPGSVASSSAMSSSDDDNRVNVFDRVLNMVMAEEKDRLNAMGMGSADHLNSSDTSRLSKKESELKAKERFSKVDAKAKAVVDAVDVGNSTNKINRDLGLRAPDRMDLAPIDMDTGLEIGGSYDAPIDMDTGLEVHHSSPLDMDTGLEVEYHDLNDDEVDKKRWKRLNEKAVIGDVNNGMKGLNMDRRPRSYDCSQQQLPEGMSYNRALSDSDRYPGDNPSSAGSSKQQSAQVVVSRTVSGSSKKTKQFWANDEDFSSKEWVAFGDK